MRRVLVGVNSETTDLWPVIHALNLAKRVKMKLFVLLVLQTPKRASRKGKNLEEEPEPSIKARLETLISEGRSWGIPIEYYVANGSFKEELIRLIQSKEISLVVLGTPTAGQKGVFERIRDILDEIKLRTVCDIEIVQPRNSAQGE